MIKVRFIDASGEVTQAEGSPGQNAMELAVAFGVDGIEAQCGGALSCATCHVYVGEAWLAQLEPASGLETDMLEFSTSEVRPNSRLSCQLKLTEAMDGIELIVPN